MRKINTINLLKRAKRSICQNSDFVHFTRNNVRVNSSFYAQGGSVVRVSRYIRHPRYSNSNGDFDYALLELAEPLNFTSGVQPIALPSENAKFEDGQIAMVSGWGDTKNISESTRQLRAAHVPLVNQEVCRKQYSGFVYEVTPRMICAGLEEGIFCCFLCLA